MSTRYGLIGLTTWLLVSTTSCSSVPVAASCPPFPPLPAIVEAEKNLPKASFASPEIDFLKESVAIFNALQNDLQGSLDAALVPSPASKPVPTGQ